MKKTQKSKTDWPARINAVLEKHGINMAQLAKRLGMAGQGTLSNIISGRREPAKCVQNLLVLMENGNSLEIFDKKS